MRDWGPPMAASPDSVESNRLCQSEKGGLAILNCPMELHVKGAQYITSVQFEMGPHLRGTLFRSLPAI